MPGIPYYCGTTWTSGLILSAGSQRESAPCFCPSFRWCLAISCLTAISVSVATCLLPCVCLRVSPLLVTCSCLTIVLIRLIQTLLKQLPSTRIPKANSFLSSVFLSLLLFSSHFNNMSAVVKGKILLRMKENNANKRNFSVSSTTNQVHICVSTVNMHKSN